MRMSGRPAAMLLTGLGIGAIGGAYLHAAAARWVGLVLVVVGIGVAIASGPPAPALPADPAVRPAKARPDLVGLGSRVEQVLRLAEEQASVHRAEAKREAERIVADARAKAQAIIKKAQRQAPGDG